MKKDVVEENLKFNALQRFLILADIIIPTIKDSHPVRMSRHLQNSGGANEVEEVDSGGPPCDFKGVKGVWPFVSFGVKGTLGFLAGGPIGVLALFSQWMSFRD